MIEIDGVHPCVLPKEVKKRQLLPVAETVS